MRESRWADVATVTLIPSASLPARTRFEVVYTERDAKVAPQIVGTFVTGDTVDTTSPEWSGFTSLVTMGLGPRVKGVITLVEYCGEPGLVFEGGVASDDQTPPGAIQIAVWTSDPGGAIDYTSPPVAYLASDVVARAGAAATARISWTSSDAFTLPGGRRTARVGMRAVDLAGNMSQPAERVVRLP